MKPLKSGLAALACALALAAPAQAQGLACHTADMTDPDSPGSGLSMAELAQRPASTLTCAAGYWAEKCGDHATAHLIYDKCIAAGYAGAMIWKALMLEDGAGTPPDPVRAAALLKQAADSDDPVYAAMGKMHYATALYLGRGVERNEAEARKWFEAAATEGNEDAREFLRTGHHTGSRDQSGRGVGMPSEPVSGQLLQKLATPAVPELPAWLPALLAAAFAAGVLRQARVQPKPAGI
jgi:uncharacterized protein